MLLSEAIDLAPRVIPTPTDETRARVPDPDGPRVAGGAAVAELEPDKDTWSRVFNLVMFVVGAAALGWMLQPPSWRALRDVLLDVLLDVGSMSARCRLDVGSMSARCRLDVGSMSARCRLDIVSMCLDAAAWHALMRPEARRVPCWRVLGAWASGMHGVVVTMLNRARSVAIAP